MVMTALAVVPGAGRGPGKTCDPRRLPQWLWWRYVSWPSVWGLPPGTQGPPHPPRPPPTWVDVLRKETQRPWNPVLLLR